jgi:hypothetical protein
MGNGGWKMSTADRQLAGYWIYTGVTLLALKLLMSFDEVVTMVPHFASAMYYMYVMHTYTPWKNNNEQFMKVFRRM